MVRLMHVHMVVVGSLKGIVFSSVFQLVVLEGDSSSSITFIGQLNCLLAIKLQDIIATLYRQIQLQKLIPHRTQEL